MDLDIGSLVKKPVRQTAIINELPKFDIETYISNYQGRTKVDRLLFIGQHCPPLAEDSFRQSIKLLKEGSDTERYRQAVQGLQAILPDDTEAQIDEEWLEETTKKVAAGIEKYEAQLHSYKHNLIKESIRMGHEDLGNFYFESGDLSNAYKSYLRMRDACTASRHIQDMSLLVIKTAILQNNWATVQQNVGKLRAVATTKEEEESLLPKITVTQGLLALQNNNFTAAAKAFMECPPKLDWPEIIAPNDVATYGGLCALASLSRKQLKDEVLENANFREYLDLEAHVRKAIKHFINARYRECLELLKEYKNNYLLDIYFTEHVEKLYHAIRKKCMVSYMIPFSDVWISEMAAEFGVSNEKLQEEVEALIMSGDLKARIDTRQKLIITPDPDEREELYRSVLGTADEHVLETKMRLFKMNMIRGGYKIRNPEESHGYEGGGGPGGGNVLRDAINNPGAGGPGRRSGFFRTTEGKVSRPH